MAEDKFVTFCHQFLDRLPPPFPYLLKPTVREILELGITEMKEIKYSSFLLGKLWCLWPQKLGHGTLLLSTVTETATPERNRFV
jgi:hypothetical protein